MKRTAYTLSFLLCVGLLAGGCGKSQKDSAVWKETLVSAESVSGSEAVAERGLSKEEESEGESEESAATESTSSESSVEEMADKENSASAESGGRILTREEEELFESVPGIFYFASGVGAWSTELYLDEDGSFQGEFHDVDMGSSADEYPNGTFYYCNFTGRFSEPEKIGSGIFRVTVEELNIDESRPDEYIDEGIHYIGTDPYGLGYQDECFFYLPGTKISDIPEDYMFWTHLFDPLPKEMPENLYGIYDPGQGAGFVGYGYQEPEVIYESVPDSFYGIWIGAGKNYEKMYDEWYELFSKGYDVQIYTSSYWSNLNPETYYVISFGSYSTEEEAKSNLAAAKKVNKDAYIKYSGDYIGDGEDYYEESNRVNADTFTLTISSMDDVKGYEDHFEITGISSVSSQRETYVVDSTTLFDDSCNMSYFGYYRVGDNGLKWCRRAYRKWQADETSLALLGVFEITATGQHVDAYYGSYWWD